MHKGDIEDFNGKPHVMCPWHGYMFNVEDGSNSIGLKVSNQYYLLVVFMPLKRNRKHQKPINIGVAMVTNPQHLTVTASKVTA